MFEVDETGHLVQPNVGDAELVVIEFKYPDVILKVSMAQGGGLCAIRIYGCRLLSINTDHPQNVIDGIVVCSSGEQMGPSAVDSMRRAVDAVLLNRKGVVLQIEPITGGGLVAVGDSTDISVSDAELRT